MSRTRCVSCFVDATYGAARAEDAYVTARRTEATNFCENIVTNTAGEGIEAGKTLRLSCSFPSGSQALYAFCCLLYRSMRYCRVLSAHNDAKVSHGDDKLYPDLRARNIFQHRVGHEQQSQLARGWHDKVTEHIVCANVLEDAKARTGTLRTT